MSLKYFHIIFIVISVLLTGGFGLWALLGEGLDGGFRVMGIVSLIGTIALLIYGVRFYKKLKSIII